MIMRPMVITACLGGPKGKAEVVPMQLSGDMRDSYSQAKVVVEVGHVYISFLAVGVS